MSNSKSSNQRLLQIAKLLDKEAFLYRDGWTVNGEWGEHSEFAQARVIRLESAAEYLRNIVRKCHAPKP